MKKLKISPGLEIIMVIITAVGVAAVVAYLVCIVMLWVAC